jgi:hypothetical protein
MIPGIAEAHHNKREATPQTRLTSISGCIALSVGFWDCIVTEFLLRYTEIVNPAKTHLCKNLRKTLLLEKVLSIPSVCHQH